MPVEFLTQAQKDQYGRFVGEPSPGQLAQYFHFDDTDHALIARRRGYHNRLGFALQLGSVRFLGTFLANPVDVPPGVTAYVNRQIDLFPATELQRYTERKQTKHTHSAEIRRIYGYREFNEPPWRFRLSRWLYARAWLTNDRPSHLFELATHWLRERKVLLPGVTTLTRLISEIRDRASLRAWQRLAALPSAEQRNELETMLAVPSGERRSRFDQLRQSPRYVSSTSLLSALERYEKLNQLGIRNLDFSAIPPVRLRALARYATAGWAPNIARMPDDRRVATLVAFAYAYEAETLDDALDLFDLLITDIAASAKTLDEKNRLRTLRDLDKAALNLAEVCRVLLDDGCPDADVRSAVFTKLPKRQLIDAIATVDELARGPDEKHQAEMVTRYRTVRRFLPHVLRTVKFNAAPAGEPVLAATEYLARHEGRRKQSYDDAPLNIVNAGWKRLVSDKEGRVSPPAYTLCVLERLQDRLRRRDVYVEGSERWGDPRAKLLHGPQWEAKRSTVCRSLGHASSADTVIEGLKNELDAAYRRVPPQISLKTGRSGWNNRTASHH